MSKKYDKCPPIPAELLEWLNEAYPERSPELHTSDREIWCQVGARRLVRGLNRIFEEQTDNIMSEDKLNVYEDEGP